MKRLLLLGLLAASSMAGPMPASPGDLDCLNHEDTLSCIAVKTVSLLSRAARASDIQLIDGVKFVRDGPIERSGKALETETVVMNELPRDATDKTLKLATMFYESAMSFLKSHSLQLNMPEGSISRALEEGRGKMKKMILPILAAAGVKIFALIPLALGGLALVALKALFVGKIALLLAGILAFQKLFSGGSSTGSFFSKSAQPAASWASAPAAQTWSSAPTAPQAQGYYRSFDTSANDAHNLAYSAQGPNEAH